MTMQYLGLQKKDCHFLGNVANSLIPLGSCFLQYVRGGKQRKAKVSLCFF